MGVTNEVSHELPRDIRFVMFVYEFLHTQCLTTIMKSQRGIDLKILLCKISGSYTFLLRMNVTYKLRSKVENAYHEKNRKKNEKGTIFTECIQTTHMDKVPFIKGDNVSCKQWKEKIPLTLE